MLLARFITLISSILSFLFFTFNAYAQEATLSGSKGGIESSSGALPNAGSSFITYAIFVAGLSLFLIGSIKLVFSLRDNS